MCLRESSCLDVASQVGTCLTAYISLTEAKELLDQDASAPMVAQLGTSGRQQVGNTKLPYGR